MLGSFSVGRTNTQRGEICATRPFGLTRALTGLNQPVMEVLAAGDVQIPSQNDTQQTGEGSSSETAAREWGTHPEYCFELRGPSQPGREVTSSAAGAAYTATAVHTTKASAT